MIYVHLLEMILCLIFSVYTEMLNQKTSLLQDKDKWNFVTLVLPEF